MIGKKTIEIQKEKLHDLYKNYKILSPKIYGIIDYFVFQ